MKVLVAHPGQQHSFRTYEALKSAGFDVKYATTVYNKKGSLTRLLSNCFLKGDNLRRANARRSEAIADTEIIQYCEFIGLITLLLIRIDKTKKIYRKWNDYVIRQFAKRIVNYVIKNDIDCIVMYDTSAKPCFETLHNIGAKTIKILDVSSAARPYQVNVYQKDIDQTGMNGVYYERSFMWKKEQIEYFKHEILLADAYISPSNYVKDSLIYCGAKEELIQIVPYGVDCSAFAYSKRKKNNKRLKIVMTAHLSYMKGAHHLLKVLREIPEKAVELHIFGPSAAVDNNLQMMASLPNVKLRGFVSREHLAEEYRDFDVFILPSLGEGFSLSVIEAMSCGLPVIVSNNAGTSDLIEQYKNGIVFKTGDDDELKEAILWMIQNYDRIDELGEAAAKKARQYSWDKYNSEYSDAVKRITGIAGNLL